jgi:hypothetical protein
MWENHKKKLKGFFFRTFWTGPDPAQQFWSGLALPSLVNNGELCTIQAEH